MSKIETSKVSLSPELLALIENKIEKRGRTLERTEQRNRKAELELREEIDSLQRTLDEARGFGN